MFVHADEPLLWERICLCMLTFLPSGGAYVYRRGTYCRHPQGYILIEMHVKKKIFFLEDHPLPEEEDHPFLVQKKKIILLQRKKKKIILLQRSLLKAPG